MDITRFINSRDIAAHFKTAFQKEDYPDLALRYAWLIWQSRYTSIAEKHQAWQELVDSFPDMEIPARRNAYSTVFSLHDFLMRYVNAEKQLLSLMYADEKDVAYQLFARVSVYNSSGGNYFAEFGFALENYEGAYVML